jgi:hypothetical protein
MEIQRNTFKNWVNEQLKSGGQSIFDLRTDFADGVLLVALIEILQRRKLPGAVRNPAHNHEKLHNITLALDAIAKDNVTLINIGMYIVNVYYNTFEDEHFVFVYLIYICTPIFGIHCIHVFRCVRGPVVKVVDFKPLAPRRCGFESRQGLQILSCDEAIQLDYGMSVVLLRCPFVPEVMHGKASEAFVHQ